MSKTYYTVDFETDELIKNAIKEIDDHLNVSEIRIMVGSGALELPDVFNREDVKRCFNYDKDNSVTKKIGRLLQSCCIEIMESENGQSYRKIQRSMI